jgi:hypothetical protein
LAVGGGWRPAFRLLPPVYWPRLYRIQVQH